MAAPYRSLIVCMALAAVLTSCALWRQPLGGRRGAYRACTDLIEKQDGLPASQAQPYASAPPLVQLTSGDYQAEVSYPKRNALYRCEVMEVVSGEWALVTLERLR